MKILATIKLPPAVTQLWRFVCYQGEPYLHFDESDDGQHTVIKLLPEQIVNQTIPPNLVSHLSYQEPIGPEKYCRLLLPADTIFEPIPSQYQ